MRVSITDIIGPIMVGPSSSHTAGAARIGRMGRRLLDEPVAEAEILLYGSFLMTHRGHGTDRALIAGLLDMPVDDARLRDSFDWARRAGMSFRFGEARLKQAHPNTAVLNLVGRTGKRISLQAASVGGGAIRVDELNGMAVSFTGQRNTLIIPHKDRPGEIAVVTACAAQFDLNIAAMQDFRDRKGGDACMLIEIDSAPEEALLWTMRKLPGIYDVIFVPAEQ